MRDPWIDVFPPMDESFERSMEHAFQAIRKENQQVKKKTSIGVLLLAIVALLGATAFAVTTSDLFRNMAKYADPIVPLDGVEEMVVSNLGSAENEYVSLTVEEAVYDGQGMIVLTRITPKDPQRYALLNLMLMDLPEDGYTLENLPVEIPDSEQEMTENGVAYRIVNTPTRKELSVNGESVQIPESRESAEAANLPVYLDNGIMYYADQMELRVTGRKDGKKILHFTVSLTPENTEDATVESLTDGSSFSAEEQPDGSVLVWIDSFADDLLPDTMQMRLNVNIFTDAEAFVSEGISFTMEKSESEHFAWYEADNSGSIGDRVTIRSVQAVMTKICAYLTIDYDYTPMEDEPMGISFRIFDPSGAPVPVSSSTCRYLDEDAGTYRELTQMQSFDSIPETLTLEAFAIGGDTLGSCAIHEAAQ